MKEFTAKELMSLVSLTLIAAGNEADETFESEAQVKAAGLAVIASDTERVLMLQRSLSEDDPAAGKWEFPGGHIEKGETPDEGAIREWTEETGVATLPTGRFTSSWTSANGAYELFVYRINKEEDLELNLDHEDRKVRNPDDPDGDNIEVLAWWDPQDILNNPAMRQEVLDIDWRVLSERPTSVSFDTEEFYNKCHDERGRFCEGEGSVVKGRAGLWDSDEYHNLEDFRKGHDAEYEQRNALWEEANESLRHPNLGEWDENKGYKDHIFSGATYSLNSVLRDPNHPDNSPEFGPIQVALEDINTLDKLFQERSVPMNSHQLFRGVGPWDAIDNLKPGDILQDAGYLSTSIDPQGAMDYFDSSPPDSKTSIFQIRTKPDTRVLTGLTPGNVKEVLLNRGTGLQIKTIASDLQTRNLIIDAEVV